MPATVELPPPLDVIVGLPAAASLVGTPEGRIHTLNAPFVETLYLITAK